MLCLRQGLVTEVVSKGKLGPCRSWWGFSLLCKNSGELDQWEIKLEGGKEYQKLKGEMVVLDPASPLKCLKLIKAEGQMAR